MWWRSRARDLLALSKPRIVALLVATGACTAVAAAGGRPGVAPMAAVVFGGGLAASGAGAINAAWEADIDARMLRTRRRPVPAGRISAGVAAAWGLSLEILAFVLTARLANLMAALLAVGGAAWYVAVYTLWLKRRTTWNIVVGGLAGSFPPLVGWAAVDGRVDATALALAGVVFWWTPPHFWALATLVREDYRRAGIPMLPVVADAATVADRMLRYAVLTVGTSLAPVAWGGLGLLYGAVALLAGLWFGGLCLAYRQRLDLPTARRVFLASGPYLLAVFLGAALDRVLM